MHTSSTDKILIVTIIVHITSDHFFDIMATHPLPQIDVSDLEWSNQQRFSNSPISKKSSPLSPRAHSPLLTLQSIGSNNGIDSIASQYYNVSDDKIMSPSGSSSTLSPTRIQSLNDDEISVDPYRILGLKRCDTLESIKKSYQRLALLSHPRRNICCKEKVGSSIENISYPMHGQTFSEETIRQWHFMVVAASYETLSLSEHRKEYDLISGRNQSVNLSKRENIGRDKNCCMMIGNGLVINNSFDIKNEQKNHCLSNTMTLLNICDTNKSKENTITLTNGGGNGGKKLLLNCKPSVLSRNETDYYGKSTGTVGSNGTEEEVYEFFREENNLFKGPLELMYRARQYQPFTDAFELFRKEFGSDIFSGKSCFDEDDDINNQQELDEISKSWVAGGSGRIKHESSDPNTTASLTAKYLGTNSKLVYPILPNIPLALLERYGVLDGAIKKVSKTINSKSDKTSGVYTNIKCEKTNGIEVKTTIKTHGDMRIVRTETSNIQNSTGDKKTITTVERQMLAQGESQQNKHQPPNKICSSLFDFVPCCYETFPQPMARPRSREQVSSNSTVSTTSSQKSFPSVNTFHDKPALRSQIEELFITRRYESRDDLISGNRKVM